MRSATFWVMGCLLAGSAWGQSVDLVLPDTVLRINSSPELRDLLAERLAQAGSRGQLGLSYRLHDMVLEAASSPRLKVRFHVLGMPVPPPDTVIVSDGDGAEWPQLAAFLRGADPSANGYLFSAGQPAWQVRTKRYFGHRSGYGVLYNLTDVSRQTVQVLAAYEQPRTGPGGIVGQVTLDLPNLLGSLRYLRVHWRRLSPLTQSIHLLYAEPRLPLLPLGAQVELRQDLRDTLYVQRAGTVQLTSPPGQLWGTAVGIGLRELTILPAGAIQGMVPVRYRHLSLVLSRQAFDQPFNPTQGFRVKLALEGGTVDTGDSQNPGALGRGELNIAWARSRSRITLAQNLYAMLLAGLDYKPQLPEYGRFGGSASLRGYREDQFLEPWGLVSQTELRYRTSETTRVHLLLDAGLLPGRRVLSAVGMGLLVGAGRNLVQLDLAWNRDDNFRTGKVHLRLINTISGGRSAKK